ncbi:MAG: DUF5715 family protein [Acidobacteriaceae bacterium]
MRYLAHNSLSRFSTACVFAVFLCLLTASLFAEPASTRHHPHARHAITAKKATVRHKPHAVPHRSKAAVVHAKHRSRAVVHKTSRHKQRVPRGSRAEEAPADKATAARVHAWLQEQHSAAPAVANTQQAPGTAAPETKPVATPAEATGVAHPPDQDFAVNIRYEKTASAKAPTVPNVVKKVDTVQQVQAPVPQVQSAVVPDTADTAEDDEDAPQPANVHLEYTRGGRLVVPAPLRGTHAILVHQNLMADREGLERVRNDADLLRLRRERRLVAIPVSRTLVVDERLPVNRRYCRPWTAKFLVDLARAHYARFHEPLQVNSAVRTVQFQEHLLRINGNAAPARGETASPHLTGETVDLAKHGLSMTEVAWMRGYLLPLVEEGKVDVEEEFQQAVFHISVYTSYDPPAAPAPQRRATPQRRRNSTSLLATGIH